MIPNCNDGSQRAPRLRFDLNIGCIAGLPEWSSFPSKLTPEESYRFMKKHGVEGLNWGDPALCQQVGLAHTGGGQILKADQAEPLMIQLQNEGRDCGVFHVGTGFESDAEMDSFAEALITAAERLKFPAYIETHRATVTQDIYRTVRWVERYPELRFNADLSHWYCGHELVYGDWDKKLAFIQPVLERSRFIHGRISNPGSVQVGVDDLMAPNVTHFKTMWTQCFRGFLQSAQPGDYFCFTPELLSADIFYARKFKDSNGVLQEESDRWQQTLLYREIAQECWSDAASR